MHSPTTHQYALSFLLQSLALQSDGDVDDEFIDPQESTLDRLKALPNIFWLVVLSCVVVYGVVVPFNNTAR
jgi:hypothetical protein